MTLHDLHRRQELLQEELNLIRREIDRRQPSRTHRCVWCKKRAAKKTINLHLSEYWDWAGDGERSITGIMMQCPHCEKWTRYYTEWQQVMGAQRYFKSSVADEGNPGEWRNAPGQ